jgi:hypothetical protein
VEPGSNGLHQVLLQLVELLLTQVVIAITSSQPTATSQSPQVREPLKLLLSLAVVAVDPMGVLTTKARAVVALVDLDTSQ